MILPAHPRPWRRGSLFASGPRRPLDRQERARFRYLLRAHARAGRVSAKAEWVGQALLKRLSEDGRCDPCHETLARDAGCSARTVRRAIAALQSLGLLRWQTRLVRTGWPEQTSNAYELIPRAAPPPPSCGGQSVRQTRKKDITTVQAILLEDAAAARAALARRRAVIEERLLGKGKRKRRAFLRA